jgi:multiple antibiotic resistance protein
VQWVDSEGFKAFLTVFTALFVALDILGALPVYFGISRSIPADGRRRVVDVSMAVALVTALGFLFLGQSIFRLIGIQLVDFKIAGGLVLLLISLADLVGKPEHESRVTGSTGIVPLAVPMITGPAVLTTLILQVGEFGYRVTIAALIANYVIAWVLLRNSEKVFKLFGKDGAGVLSKLAALLLAAIAVSMIRGGLIETFAVRA